MPQIYRIDDIINPTGVSMGLGNKSLVLHAYEQRYYLMKDTIQWACCKYNHDYVFHMRIPSESKLCKDLRYDIVFDFFPNNVDDERSYKLDNYGLRVYSNCPSFTFTFTYAFNKFHLLVPWLIDKCSKQCLTQPAIVRNRNHQIGTDMKTWFAAFHIQRLKLLLKSNFDNAINADINQIYQSVISQQMMLQIRVLKEKEGRENRTAEKKKARDDMRRMQMIEYNTGKSIERQIRENNRTAVNQIRDPRGAAKKIVAQMKKAIRPKGPKKPRRHR